MCKLWFSRSRLDVPKQASNCHYMCSNFCRRTGCHTCYASQSCQQGLETREENPKEYRRLAKGRNLLEDLADQCTKGITQRSQQISAMAAANPSGACRGSARADPGFGFCTQLTAAPTCRTTSAPSTTTSDRELWCAAYGSADIPAQCFATWCAKLVFTSGALDTPATASTRSTTDGCLHATSTAAGNASISTTRSTSPPDIPAAACSSSPSCSSPHVSTIAASSFQLAPQPQPADAQVEATAPPAGLIFDPTSTLAGVFQNIQQLQHQTQQDQAALHQLVQQIGVTSNDQQTRYVSMFNSNSSSRLNSSSKNELHSRSTYNSSSNSMWHSKHSCRHSLCKQRTSSRNFSINKHSSKPCFSGH